MYKMVPTKIGKVYQGDNSFGIAADGYPIFGFGTTLADAHIHWLKSCYAYLRHVPLNEGAPMESNHEERLLVV